MSTKALSVNYECNGQNLQIDAMTVRQYLVNGGGSVTDQEIAMFLRLCEGQKLNPFIREVHLVKYGNQPANIVIGKDAFTRRAESNQNYKGAKSGIIVINLKNEVEYREGTFYLKKRGEELVGGWARIIFKDCKEDVFNTVSIDEYVGLKKDGTVNSMWASKPATMIKKVALVQALREAFPSALNQCYTEEEMQIQEELPQEEIKIEDQRMKLEEVPAPPKPATKLQKEQIMQLGASKGLVTGTGREANVSKLEALAQEAGLSLRGITEEGALKLIEILNVPVDNAEQEANQEEIPEVNAEVVKDNEIPEEDEPF